MVANDFPSHLISTDCHTQLGLWLQAIGTRPIGFLQLLPEMQKHSHLDYAFYTLFLEITLTP